MDSIPPEGNVPHERREYRSSRAWTKREPPSAILVVRFHAIGDVAITLPFVQHLSGSLQVTAIDYLTSAPARALPGSTVAIRTVHTHEIGPGTFTRLLKALRTGIAMRKMRYDVVVDLQRNWISRIIRIIAAPRAWSEFDRFSPKPAGVRVVEALRSAGFDSSPDRFRVNLHDSMLHRARGTLIASGWDSSRLLVCINPAGAFPSRQWPLDSYVRLMALFRSRFDCLFLLIGTDRILEKASALERQAGTSVINLTGKTDLHDAYALIQYADLCISEDSGLMHMCWTSGVPTLALFGSSRNDWSRPLGPDTVCLHSGDLPCGSCMDVECRFGDVHCLTRYSPEFVYDTALTLLRTRRQDLITS